MHAGCRKTPYPSERILSFIHKNGGRIILTSDCHDKEKLGFRFDETEAELKKIGFSDCFALPDFKALKIRVVSIHNVIPMSVGISAASKVHFMLAVSFFIVSSVVRTANEAAKKS